MRYKGFAPCLDGYRRYIRHHHHVEFGDRRYSISLVLLLFSEHRHSSDVGETANATYAPCADHQSVQICVQGTSPVSEESATHITWCRDTARNARTEGFRQHRRRRTMLETV